MSVDKKNRILLIGSIPLSLGYLHAVLEKQYVVKSVSISDTVRFHAKNVVGENVKEYFLHANIAHGVTADVVDILGGLADGFNKLLNRHIYEDVFTLGHPRIKWFLETGRQTYASKLALELLYPTFFQGGEDSSFYFIKDEIEKYKPQVIGLQINTIGRDLFFNLIEKIHKEYPDIHLVVGGLHATTEYGHILKNTLLLM